MTSFPHLLAPGRLGSLELRNRIAMAPMGTNLAEDDGTVGDRQAAWFEARARGGAGLVIVGSASVAYPVASTDRRQIAASDDAQLPGLRRLADDAHRHGAAIAAQLVHNGTNSLLDIAEGRPLLVPSKKRPPALDPLSMMVTAEESAGMLLPFSSPTARYQVREATDDDLAWAVDRFVDAARRCQRAGFDGIELHAGHGYLLHSFLSPASNTRTDRWGGSVLARAELFVTVVRAVRAAVGPTFPLWARVGAFEAHREPGQRIEDAVVAMGLGIDAGLDAIHVTAYGEPMVATGITDGHTPHRPGALLEHSARVRRELDVPVIAMGRLTPEAAEQAMADGMADVIAMGRALIADPDLPTKLVAGRRDRVRPCAYQYRCIGAIFLNEPVMCSVNPEAGHEAEAGAGPAGSGRRVVVAGGGPAGLECARRLAERGHDVELWERSDNLGGRLALAEQADGDLAGLLAWLAGAATDAGVAVRLSTPADEATLAASGADVVIWAVGGDWSTDGALGVDDLRGWLAGETGLGEADLGGPLARHVEPGAPERSGPLDVEADEIATVDDPGVPLAVDGEAGASERRVPLARDADPSAAGDDPSGPRAIDTDPSAIVEVHGSSKAAVSIAARAAQRGHSVTLVADDPVLAPELGLPGRFRLVADLYGAGVVVAEAPGAADIRIAVTRRPGPATPSLVGIEVHAIGDVTGTGGLAAALSQAAAVAASI